jgi:hypothetical protein
MADARALERRVAAWYAELQDVAAAKEKAVPIVRAAFMPTPTRALRKLRKADYDEESDAESVESEASSITESMRSDHCRLGKQVAMLSDLVAKRGKALAAKPAGTRFGKLVEADVESDGSDSN